MSGKNSQYTIKSGYCFLLRSRRSWQDADDERWEIEVYTPKGDEVFVGTRMIDGVWHAIFRCKNNRFRAITVVSALMEDGG